LVCTRDIKTSITSRFVYIYHMRRRIHVCHMRRRIHWPPFIASRFVYVTCMYTHTHERLSLSHTHTSIHKHR